MLGFLRSFITGFAFALGYVAAIITLGAVVGMVTCATA